MCNDVSSDCGSIRIGAVKAQITPSAFMKEEALKRSFSVGMARIFELDVNSFIVRSPVLMPIFFSTGYLNRLEISGFPGCIYPKPSR